MTQPNLNFDPQPDRRLESWKEIAAYLQRNAVTVRRWEKEEGLPIHRHSHKSRSSVYAYAGEIDAWRASRKVSADAPAQAAWKRLLTPSFALTLGLCLVLAGNGIRPASAEQTRGAKALRLLWSTRGNESPSGISPDGRYVSFTDFDSWDLCVRDLKTGTTRRLTDTGGIKSGNYAETMAVFSPDSRHIAYWWEPKDSPWELRTVPVSGGASKLLYKGKSSDDYVLPQGWSPDGKQVLVVHASATAPLELALIPAEGGAPRKLRSLPSGVNTTFSPDGRWIAFDPAQSADTRDGDIFVISVDGGRDMPVVQNPAKDSHPVWSPDGSQILFLSNRTGRNALWSVPFHDGKAGPEQLVEPSMPRILDMILTRRGALTYSVRGGAGPNVYSADLGPDGKAAAPPRMIADKFVNSNDAPSVAPDGLSLAYVSRRPGGNVLVIRTLKTGDERILPLSIAPMRIAWFPDGGSVLALSRDRASVSGFRFDRIDIATGAAEKILSEPDWVLDDSIAPDGKALFYTGAGDRLVRFDLETRRETILRNGEYTAAVAVSPDSKQLAFIASISSGASYIGIMPAAGGASREILRATPWVDATRFTLAWTPDQRYLLFIRAVDGESGPESVWRVPAAGGPAEQIGLSLPAHFGSLQFHPDGRTLFFAANEGTPNEVWTLENFLSKIGDGPAAPSR